MLYAGAVLISILLIKKIYKLVYVSLISERSIFFSNDVCIFFFFYINKIFCI